MAAAQDLYLQLKISEFCERCAVCGRSLIGIYDLHTQQIYWCVPQDESRDLDVYVPQGQAQPRGPARM